MLVLSLMLTLHSLSAYRQPCQACAGKTGISDQTSLTEPEFLEKNRKLFEDCVRNGTIPDTKHQKCYRYGTQGMCQDGELLFLDPSKHLNTLGRFQILISINHSKPPLVHQGTGLFLQLLQKSLKTPCQCFSL